MTSATTEREEARKCARGYVAASILIDTFLAELEPLGFTAELRAQTVRQYHMAAIEWARVAYKDELASGKTKTGAVLSDNRDAKREARAMARRVWLKVKAKTEGNHHGGS